MACTEIMSGLFAISVFKIETYFLNVGILGNACYLLLEIVLASVGEILIEISFIRNTNVANKSLVLIARRLSLIIATKPRLKTDSVDNIQH